MHRPPTGPRARRLIAPALIPVLFAIPPSRATAQVDLAVDAELNSNFVWRGVTSTNRFVIDPELRVSSERKGMTFAVDIWGNIEPGRHNGPHDLSSLNGLRGPFVTQTQFTVEAGKVMGSVNAAIGAQTYVYPRIGGLAGEFNTSELYGTLELDAPVSPSLMVAYDVAKVRGAYFETALARDFALSDRTAVVIGVIAGWSAGQAANPNGRETAYFSRDGITHVEMTAGASLVLGELRVAPAAHLILARDAHARVTAPNQSRGVKLWLGTTVAWARPSSGHKQSE